VSPVIRVDHPRCQYCGVYLQRRRRRGKDLAIISLLTDLGVEVYRDCRCRRRRKKRDQKET